MFLFLCRSLRIINGSSVKKIPGKKAQAFAAIGTFIVVGLGICGFLRRSLFNIGFNRTFELLDY